jgi:uncharacterized protein YegP (UPF0339 family)
VRDGGEEVSARVITVKVYRCAPGRRGSRGQRWRWTAFAANGRKMATAGEAYTNEKDCLDAVQVLFGTETRAWREHPDQPEAMLRDAQS